MGKGGRKRGRETSICGRLLQAPTRGLAHNPGMCPDWESNQRFFGSQAHIQSSELYQSGWKFILFLSFVPSSETQFLNY